MAEDNFWSDPIGNVSDWATNTYDQYIAPSLNNMDFSSGVGDYVGVSPSYVSPTNDFFTMKWETYSPSAEALSPEINNNPNSMVDYSNPQSTNFSVTSPDSQQDIGFRDWIQQQIPAVPPVTDSPQKDLSIAASGSYVANNLNGLQGTVVPSEGDIIRARSSIQTPAYDWLAKTFPNSDALGQLSWARFLGPGGGVPFPDPNIPVVPGSFEEKVIKPYVDVAQVPVNRQQQLSDSPVVFQNVDTFSPFAGRIFTEDARIQLPMTTQGDFDNVAIHNLADAKTTKHELDHYTNLKETPTQNRIAINGELTEEKTIPDVFVGLDKDTADRGYGGKIRNPVEVYPRGFEDVPYGQSNISSPHLRIYAFDNSNLLDWSPEDPLYKTINPQNSEYSSHFSDVLNRSDPSRFWGGETSISSSAGATPSPSNTMITNTNFIPDDSVAGMAQDIPRELTYDSNYRVPLNRVTFNGDAVSGITGVVSILPVALMAYHEENDAKNMNQEQKNNYVYDKGGWMLGLGKPSDTLQYHVRKRRKTDNKTNKRIIF